MRPVRVFSLALAEASDEALLAAATSVEELDAASVPGLIDLAATLDGVGRSVAAGRLLRVAAGLAPELPLTYQSAMQLASRSEAGLRSRLVRWAGPGLLRTLYGRDADAIRARTRRYIEREAVAFEADGRGAAAAALRRRAEIAERVDLSIELSWLGEADLDLRVIEPGGTVCGTTTRRTTGGGIHAGDGFGPNAWERYVAPRGRSGVYQVVVERLWGEVAGKRATLTVTRHGGGPDENTSEYVVELSGPRTELSHLLRDGRREGEAVTTSLGPQRPDRELDLSPTPAGRAAADRFGQAIGGGTPFVAGGQATVGAGVAAFQPVIEFIPEGVSNSVSAVVSADRRYVRLTVSPSFTSIVGVTSFGFVTTR